MKKDGRESGILGGRKIVRSVEKLAFYGGMSNAFFLIFANTKQYRMNVDEIRLILNQEAEAVRNIPASEEYHKAINLIIEYVHDKKGKLITSGMGKAGQIAMNVATTFSSTGTPSFFLHPSEAQHGDLGIIRENDIMLLISNSGYTRELIELVGLTKGLSPEIKMIVITGNPESDLAKEATICLTTGNPREVCALGLTPTTSTTVMTVIGDILVVGTMKRINFTSQDYAKRHHGGYLGTKSRGESR
jgi:arabinose-5-phosphate isomerase